MNLEPIGVVHSPVTAPVDERWGDVVAEIHLRPELAAGLQGLDQFSHVIVIFYMHEAMFAPAPARVRPPRGQADIPPLGISPQRPRHRPTPLGLTAVPLLGIAGPVVRVRGLDAVDG